MYKFIVRFSIIFILSIILLGCSNSANDVVSDENSSVVDNDTVMEDENNSVDIVIDENTLNIQSIVLPTSDIYPNSLHRISIEVYSSEEISVDNNDSSVFFFFSLEDVSDANKTVWFDSDSLSLIKEGTHSYEFTLEIPYDTNASTYTLNVSMGDSNVTYEEFSSPSFAVLENDGKPDIEILAVTLDLEHSGLESEFDDITSSEINSTAINLLAENLTAMSVEILNQDEPLEISSTVTLISNMQDSSDVNISACIAVASGCNDIPILQIVTLDENVSINSDDEDNLSLTGIVEPVYSSKVELGFLEANVEKVVSLDFLIDPSDVTTFVSALLADALANPSSVLDASIKVTIETSGESEINPTQNNVLNYPIKLFLNEELLATLSEAVSVGDTNLTLDDTTDLLDNYFAPPLSRAVSGECGLKKLEWEKEYEKYKYGKRFGAGVYLKGRTWLDVDGVHAKSYGSLRIRRFSDTKHRILRLDASADLDPNSFSNTGYDIELSSLGYSIYTKSYSLAELTELPEPEVELTAEEEASLEEASAAVSRAVDSNTTVSTRATLLRQKRIKAVKDSLRNHTTTTSNNTLVSLERNWRLGKNTERTTTIMFAILPIVVTAGAEANIGFDASIGLDGITSITAMVEPNAYIAAYLEAGVGAGVSCCWTSINYSAGVGSYLWLVSERFTNTATGSLVFVEEGDYITEIVGQLHMNVTNYISTMSGKTYAYASYFGPRKWSEPTDTDWKNRRMTKDFADWEGGRYTRELLDKNWNIFSIPLADSCD